MSKKILIMAGGTGGHIFPAIAVAAELKKRGISVAWLGTTNGMENTIVPKHGIKLHAVRAVGLRGKNVISLIKAPFLLSLAVVQIAFILRKVKPDAVLGMGGFVAGLGGFVAWVFRIPVVIHEQNTVAGTSNKLLQKIAKKTFQAFDGAFEKATTVGNPISFSPQPKRDNRDKLNLLVIGGSLGARPINSVVSQLDLDINIWHQTGKLHLKSVTQSYQNRPVKLSAFIEDMAAAYAWSDVVLCRAGAMTVSELMSSGSASILVPLPHAIDNHQFFNAKILTDNQAGILILQQDLSIEQLEKTLISLTPAKIKRYSINAKALAKPRAATQIADYLGAL